MMVKTCLQPGQDGIPRRTRSRHARCCFSFGYADENIALARTLRGRRSGEPRRLSEGRDHGRPVRSYREDHDTAERADIGVDEDGSSAIEPSVPLGPAMPERRSCAKTTSGMDR